MRGTRSVDVVRLADGRFENAADRVAVEAALEVRLNGHPFAVIMRTPGADADLVAGFLLSEGVIRSADDVHRLDRPDADGVLNVVLSRSRAEILPDLLEARRNVAQNSSCGMCGRRTLESLEIDRPPLAVEWHLDTTVLAGLPAALRHAQHAFDETGGLHAAGLFDLDGRLQSSAEDVGRHNAVDKLLGRTLMAGQLPLSRSALVRQRPIVVRDRAESVPRRHSARRRRVGALEPGGRSGASDRHHPARLRARRPVQHLHASVAGSENGSRNRFHFGAF